MVPVAQPRLRVLLGLLGMAGGRMVSAEALVDGLWGEEWSPGREKNLHALVYQLRRRLAGLEADKRGARLARAGSGYRLVLGPGELDVEVFRDLARRGREAARAGDAAGARELFGQALELWRGAALADAAPLCSRLAGEAARLEEARLAVVEERIGADLALGRHGEVAAELAGLVEEFPLRERLAVLLMTALYRCGRRGEALAVYDATRRVLAEQLGLDPGPELAGLQAQVLADDAVLAVPAGAALGAMTGGPVPPEAAVAGPGMVPRQLPTGAGFFAGRAAELKELDELLDRVGGEGGAVVISAVAGMAGVGKTALAVHWARRAAGRFPDGQLYVNLRGYDAGPAVTPAEAAGWFLAALGVSAFQIPADAQARFGLYRSVLAERRVLIVLDNARDAEQARPLLPGGGKCLVVVTSRSALTGLVTAEGARPLRLGPLSADDAIKLLAGRLGLERVAAEPEVVTELAARCGHLPLALAVMAARAAADPGLPLGILAGRLAETSDDGATVTGRPFGNEGARLDVLETGDTATSLRELLSWSHRQLSAPAAAMFALLGMHCGPDITVPAAASLAGVTSADAGRALTELASASLAAEHRPGRYVMHDLVRGYAAEHSRQSIGQAGIGEAIARSLDHYLHTMIISSPGTPRGYAPTPPARGVVPERLADAQRLDWARAEHQVLLRAIAQAAAVGQLARAWQIFECQAWFLGGKGYWADFQAAGQAILAAAQAVGDHASLGWAHTVIGRYCTFVGAYGEDRAHLAEAADHFRTAGDLRGQATALLYASLACNWHGDWAQGAVLAEQALALRLALEDQPGQGWALVSLGESHAQLGNYERARGYARQALEAAPDTGFVAIAWNVLGLVHFRIGEHHQAISCYRQALVIAREWKTPVTRRWRAGLLVNFGDACRAAGDLPAAAGAWTQALQDLDDLRLPDSLRVRARLEQASRD